MDSEMWRLQATEIKFLRSGKGCIRFAYICVIINYDINQEVGILSRRYKQSLSRAAATTIPKKIPALEKTPKD